MKNEIKDILERLEKGEINGKKAVKLIKKIGYNFSNRSIKATKFKIIITDKNEGKSLPIPSIPFWLAKSMCNICIKLIPLGIKYSNSIDEETKTYLKKLKNLDFKEVFKILKENGPFEVLHIVEGDNTEIKIAIL